MRRFRLDRRAVLKGAGSIAIALPFMEIMLDERLMAADVTSAKRFITFFTPGGTVLKNWLPTGSESSFEFGSILKPLDAVKGKVMPVSGLNMIAAQGEQHQCGNVAVRLSTKSSPRASPKGSGSRVSRWLSVGRRARPTARRIPRIS